MAHFLFSFAAACPGPRDGAGIFPEPGEDEIFKIFHLYLLSLITEQDNVKIEINGKAYQQTGDSDVPYLGYLPGIYELLYAFDGKGIMKSLVPWERSLWPTTTRLGIRNVLQRSVKIWMCWCRIPKENHTAQCCRDPGGGEILAGSRFFTLSVFLCSKLFI